MDLNRIRLAFNLLGPPLALLGASSLMRDMASHVQPGMLAVPASTIVFLIAMAMELAAAGLVLHATFRTVQWRRGRGQLCDTCFGPTRHKEGRYGPYLKCLACGTNRRFQD